MQALAQHRYWWQFDKVFRNPNGGLIQLQQFYLLGIGTRAQNETNRRFFADSAFVHDVLAGGGWRDVAVTPLDVPCAFPAAALDRYIGGVGPVGLALRQANADTRNRVLAAGREALAPFVHGDTVRFLAATWRIAARA